MNGRVAAVYPSAAAVRSTKLAGPAALPAYLARANKEVEIWLQVLNACMHAPAWRG